MPPLRVVSSRPVAVPAGRPVPQPRPKPLPVPAWTPGTVERALVNQQGWETGREKVRAVVHGKFAVHQDDRGLWVLTSVATGWAAGYYHQEADARRVGEYLWDRWCLAFSQPTKDKVLEKLPAWARAWAIACHRTHAWIEPSPYERGDV